MAAVVVHIFLFSALTLVLVRSRATIGWQTPVLLLFSPVVAGTLLFVTAPLFWEATLGPDTAPGDTDGRQAGTALMLIFGLPLTLLANMGLFLGRRRPATNTRGTP